ncbi:MAG: hypothetical protein EA349_06035 [Halomonadaceae bacterium]|nr:MAG: hypothetical protein EA349_06035 [Halomonadaceae bacterium]
MTVLTRLYQWILIAGVSLFSAAVQGGIVLSQGDIPVAQLSALCSSEDIGVNGTTITCRNGSFAIDERTITADVPFELFASNGLNVRDSALADNSSPISLTAQNGGISIANSFVRGTVKAAQSITISESEINGNVDSQNGEVTLASAMVEGSVVGTNAITVNGANVSGGVTTSNGVLSVSNSEVDGNLQSNNAIIVSATEVGGNVTSTNGELTVTGSRVGGDLSTNTNIGVDSSSIGGDITATPNGTITLNNSSVAGTCSPETPGCNEGEVRDLPFCSATFSAGSGINPNTPLDLSSVQFTPTENWPGNNTELTGGIYRYNGNLDRGNYNLSIADGEQVVIFVNETLRFGGNNQTNINVNGDPDQLVIVVNGNLNGRNNLRFNGILYASNTINFGNNSVIVGLLAAGGRIDTGGGGSGFSPPQSNPARSLGIEGVCRAEDEQGELTTFQVQGPAQASVCEPAEIRVRAVDGDNNLLPDYQGSVNLSNSAGRGNWSVFAGDGTLEPDPHDNDDGLARYNFASGDGGEVILGLGNRVADRLRVSATGVDTGVTGISGLIAFLENAFVLSLTDPLGSDLIAGRPHELTVRAVRRNENEDCGLVTSYDGTVPLKAWVQRDDLDPSGQDPRLEGELLSDGVPGADNVELSFNAGTAQVQLDTTDVGRYALRLRDDTSGNVVDENGEPLPVNGSSADLTVRPFAFAVTVPGNQGVEGPGGDAFLAAGRPFTVDLRAVLWSSDADRNEDGQPDDHDGESPGARADLSATTTVPSFALGEGSLELSSRLGAGPIDPADPSLRLTEEVSDFTGGEASAVAAYDEVGSIGLLARFSGSYLGRNVELRGDSGFVGRFHPEEFTARVLMNGAFAPFCGEFAYIGQGFGYIAGEEPELTLSARGFSADGQGALLSNYREQWQRLQAADVALDFPGQDGDNSLAVLAAGNTGTLVAMGDGRMDYQLAPADEYQYEKSADSRIDPFSSALSITLRAVDDGDASLAPELEAGGDSPVVLSPQQIQLRYGRLRLENTFGPGDLDLVMPLRAEFRSDGEFILNQAESGASEGPGACFIYNPVRDSSLSPEDVAQLTSEDAEFQLFAGEAQGTGRLTLQGLSGSIAADQPRHTEVTFSAPHWLQDDFNGDGDLSNPRATATFGVYRGHDRIIYWEGISR